MGKTNKTTFEKYTWVLHKRQVKQEIKEISLVLRHTKDFLWKKLKISELIKFSGTTP